MIKKLKQTAIEWHPMLPIQPLKGKWRRPDLRNHRKIVVVDGRTAFAGSQNMIDPGYTTGSTSEWPEVARVGHPEPTDQWRTRSTWCSPPTGTSRRVRCFAKPSDLTQRGGTATWSARWFPADRVSRTRTTFDCSTR